MIEPFCVMIESKLKRLKRQHSLGKGLKRLPLKKIENKTERERERDRKKRERDR